MTKQNLAQALKVLLADTYALYLKTHNYHWNVEGKRFVELHTFFETQYTELATAVDTIAETIRMLGDKAPGSFKTFQGLTQIQDGNENASATEMVVDLAKDQALVMKSTEAALNIAKELYDEATIGLLADRLSIHRKAEWMLRSMAE